MTGNANAGEVMEYMSHKPRCKESGGKHRMPAICAAQIPDNIDNPKTKRGDLQVRVPQLNGDPAFFFFRKTVGIGSRQDLDQ